MNFRQTTLIAALALGSLPVLAQTAAAPASAWTVAGNAGLFSDYTFRGISQTARKPAFQGGIDVAHASGFYVGNWNSNISSPVRFSSYSAGVPYHSASLGHTDAHIGARPTDVRS